MSNVSSPMRAERLLKDFHVHCNCAIATRAGVQGSDQQEVRGEGRRGKSTRNRHDTILQRLTHDLQRSPIEFGHLVQKQNAVMSHRDLTGHGRATSAYQTSVADRVMRRAKRSSGLQRLADIKRPRALLIRVVSSIPAVITWAESWGTASPTSSCPKPCTHAPMFLRHYSEGKSTINT